MDFLGVGPLELVFILLIALLVLGPRDIARFARKAGRFLNRLYRSELWGTLSKASQEFRNLPNRLAREAALDDLDESLKREFKGDKSQRPGEEALDAWRPSPKTGQPEGDSTPAPEAPSDSDDTADA